MQLSASTENTGTEKRVPNDKGMKLTPLATGIYSAGKLRQKRLVVIPAYKVLVEHCCINTGDDSADVPIQYFTR